MVGYEGWLPSKFDFKLCLEETQLCYAILTSFSSWLLWCSEGIKSIAGHHISPSFQKLPCMWRHILCCRLRQNIMLVKHFKNHLRIYGFIILGARGVFPALSNMAARGTTSSKQYKLGNSCAWRRTHSGAKLALFRWNCPAKIFGAQQVREGKIYRNLFMDACLNLHAFELNYYCLICGMMAKKGPRSGF